MADPTLIALDRQHLIHPVSNFREHERSGALVLQSGRGAWLRDVDGREYLDAFAGLWCVNVGYGQQSVVRAAAEQMERLPYATGYFDFASEASIRLAAKLVELAPRSLRHVYFTLGGSDAIDSALRFITRYWNARGESRRKHFIALERGYHGSSSVGSGLTALKVFHAGFDMPLATQHHIPSPYPYRNPVGSDPAAIIAASVAALRSVVLGIGADQVAAFFVEPVQGSGGVIVPPRGWLSAMQDACRELGILLVADEVITGFGRTGPLFAVEEEGVEPDLMTLAKGLTSGYAPMGAVMVSSAVYDAIADATPRNSPVGHGHTYSGHPVSAAVALEVLRLYHEGGLLENGRAMAPRFEAGLQALREHPLVGDARQRGLLGALELVADKRSRRPFDASLKLSERITSSARRHGVIFRAFGDNILGFAPALCCGPAEFDALFERLTRVLDEIQAEPDVRQAVSAP
jgi:adenosylmethionine-8-amino-7-oxononanoate aminotransferase